VKLTVLIDHLERIKAEHGDLEVIDSEGDDDFDLEVQGKELILCQEA
jgi:hypothetical protein